MHRKKRRIALWLFMVTMCLWHAAYADKPSYYEEMPPYLRVEQETVSQEVIRNVFVRSTYPQTANESVNAQMRELVDDMTEKARPYLPMKTEITPTYLDVGAVITRSGTSWMSFLTIAEVSAMKEQSYVDMHTRVYDIETGERIELTDVFDEQSRAWDVLADEVRAQLSAAFPKEEADAQRLEMLCSRESLQEASFTLGAARLTLTYRADEIYPGKQTLLHVHVYYPQIRSMMTKRAQAQTDNSRFQMIALTFDDGGARGSTRRVLDQLRRYGAQATFFVVGYTFASNHDILARQQDAGYSIQSHTYSHRYPGELTADEAFWEKERFSTELSDVIGIGPTMMRAPGGQDVFYARREIGYPIIQWSLAGGDSGNKDIAGIYKRVARNAKDGDIVLLHDLNGLCSEYTRHILKSLNEQGILCVTMEELFADAGIPLEKNRSYYSARLDGQK